MVCGLGEGVMSFVVGDWVGVLWLGLICGYCVYCIFGCENLCDNLGFMGYMIDGGYVECVVVDYWYCVYLLWCYFDLEVVLLLCVGLIGYWILWMVGDVCCIGIYGFGVVVYLVV